MAKRQRRAKKRQCELCGKSVPVQYLVQTFGGYACFRCLGESASTKACPRCGEEKALHAFGFRKKRGGLKSWCRACQSEYNQELRARDGYKEKHAAYMREWRAKRKDS